MQIPYSLYQATPIAKANGKNGYTPNLIDGEPGTYSSYILVNKHNADFMQTVHYLQSHQHAHLL